MQFRLAHLLIAFVPIAAFVAVFVDACQRWSRITAALASNVNKTREQVAAFEYDSNVWFAEAAGLVVIIIAVSLWLGRLMARRSRTFF
jgi:hypothetical protein